MRQLTISVALLLISFLTFSQNFVGIWAGELDIQGTKLPIVFHLVQEDGGLEATMDSPSQGAMGIPVSQVEVNGKSIELKLTPLQISYKGALVVDELIEGTFTQAGFEFPLNLTKSEKVETVNRPQEPKEPFPYQVEEVSFRNAKEDVTLAGTLTLPKSGRNFKSVVLISGSGPQDRNEEVFGHKPFLVLADYLTRNGIAVLRFDDRGVGQSTGVFATGTTANFATDVEAAVEYLKGRKEIDAKSIGLIGHSEGGIIAPMVAARNSHVAFIVMMAGTGIRGAELLLMQQEAINRASGVSDEIIQKTAKLNGESFNIVLENEGVDIIKTKISQFLTTAMKEQPELFTMPGTDNEKLQALQAQFTPWMVYFLKHDPAPNLEKLDCPVLAINGDKDLQVPSSANLQAIEQALKRGGNKRYTIKEYSGLNHLFQESSTGLPTEYGVIEQTIAPQVLSDLAKWINKL